MDSARLVIKSKQRDEWRKVKRYLVLSNYLTTYLEFKSCKGCCQIHILTIGVRRIHLAIFRICKIKF